MRYFRAVGPKHMASWLGLVIGLLSGLALPAGSAPDVLAAENSRIVSLAPSVTETVFALGAGPQLVGVSQYCGYPPAALKLPKVGSFLTPNVEAIAALRPTLIIGLGMSSDQRQIRALEAMGYPTLMVNDSSVAEVRQSIRIVGRRIGRPDEAGRLLEAIRSHLSRIRKRLNGAKHVKVLMVVGHQPMVAVGSGTYLAELLKLAHGDNIAAGLAQAWPRVNLEYIIAARPEVILDGQMGNDASLPGEFWDRYPTIPAVRNHRIYGYPQDPIMHPGPRLWRSLEIIASRLHPERFKESGGGDR